MIQEEKDLVLKDLSARLPYGVKAHYVVYHTVKNEYDEWDGEITELSDFIPGCKPYLRPMSSMTEEEREEYKKFDDFGSSTLRKYEYQDFTVLVPSYDRLDWLLAHHFDFRGLISLGLALEAPEGMYKFE